jgi:hypothetical protein
MLDFSNLCKAKPTTTPNSQQPTARQQRELAIELARTNTTDTPTHNNHHTTAQQQQAKATKSQSFAPGIARDLL